MLAITGFFFSSRARTSSRQIRSDAVPSPPGESTRTTIAETAGSSAARRMRPMIASDPARRTTPNGSRPPSPRTMSPTTRTTAIRGRPPPRRARHPGPSEEIRRVLVGADAEELRPHTELVEARGGEQCRRGKTVDQQDRLRSGVDPVGRESNTIFEVAAAFQIEKHFLAGTPEIFDACAQFFRPGEPERHAPGAKDDGFRRWVTRHAPQRGEGFGEGVAGCPPGDEHERLGRGVGERLLQIDLR